MAKWFSDEEIAGLKPELVEMLDKARGLAGVPFFITSGLRTAEENKAAGGVDGSAHTRGLAVDLSCTNSHVRMRMVTALLVAGFERLGVYDRHLHVDLDETPPKDVIWVGVSH